MAIPVDTLHVKINISVDERFLKKSGWGFHSIPWKDGRGLIWYTYTYRTRYARVDFRYYVSDYVGKTHLDVRISSLPKLAYGKCYIKDYCLADAIRRVIIMFKKHPRLPDFDLWKGMITRIDFYLDLFFGEETWKIIEAVGRLSIPHRCRQVFQNTLDRYARENNGAWFKSHPATFRAYDKYQQCGDPEASGILRLEVQLVGEGLERAFGHSFPKVKELNSHVWEIAITGELKSLGLDRLSISGKSKAFETLLNRYEKKHALDLLARMQLKTEHPDAGNEILAERQGVCPKTVERYDREIRKAGLQPIIADDDTTMPACIWEIIKFEMEQICAKTPSDTHKGCANSPADPTPNKNSEEHDEKE